MSTKAGLVFQSLVSKLMYAAPLRRLAEVKISRLLSLRRKFLYDLTLKGEEERSDALLEMER